MGHYAAEMRPEMAEQPQFTDFFGNELKVGFFVLRAYRYGNTAKLELRKITRIEDGKLYLDDSHVPVQNFNNLARYPT